MHRAALWRAAQLLFAAAVILFAWRELAPNRDAIANAFSTMHIRVGLLVLASVLVLASYAVLIETWRRTMSAWGSTIPFATAARIWFVSNLARWIPAMQIAAMGGLAKQAGASPFAAAGASLLIAVVNLLAGVAVILLTASDALRPMGIAPPLVIGLAVLAAAIALMPRFLPAVAQWAGRRFRRDFSWPAIPYHTVLVAYGGCALAWVLYGIAFQLMVASAFGAASGATRHYIAVFTASYGLGYIMLLVPGGLGVREGAMITLMTKYGMATLAGATAISIVARVWLTVLETVPGLILLALLPKGARSKTNG